MPLGGFSDEVIEESRTRLGVPQDWVAEMCATGCGDLVWIPPDARSVATDNGMPFVVTCSANCLQEFVANYRPR